MPKRTFTVEDLWALPRVAAPVPSPDGEQMIVPVTTYSMEANKGTTCLYLIDSATKGAEPGDGAIALTAAEVSSSNPVWSPDGRHAAFLRRPGAGSKGVKYPEQTQLYLLSLSGGEPERLTDLPLGVEDPRWFPDGKRIAFLSPIHPSAPTPEGTGDLEKTYSSDPVQAWVTEDRVYRFWDRWLPREAVHHLFVLDLSSRRVTDLTPRSSRRFDLMDAGGQYAIAPDGREIAFSADRSLPPNDPLLSGVFLLKLPRSGPAAAPVCVSKHLPAHAFAPIYSPDGAWIVYGFQRRYDFYADRVLVGAYERRTRRHVVLTEAWDASPHAWSFDAKGRTLYLHAEHRGSNAIFALDFPQASRLSQAGRRTKPALPERLVSGAGYSPPRFAGGRLFVSRSTLSEPAEAGSFDANGKRWVAHTSFTSPIMSQIALGRTEEIQFTGANGRKVQMYVVHPPAQALPKLQGKKPRLPLVHLIHGGPHGAFPNEWHWRWNAQLFAAPGRIAALVNFHGSTGFGQKFCESILGSWGDQPYKDIMAATDHLIDRGLVDPRRLAATGGSYGGYLAAWIASQTDRFACIVNHAGCCDFQSQYATDITQDFGPEAGGELFDGIEQVDRYNPMRHAKGFRSPMLVLHGERDYRVPYVQGIEIYNVYKAMDLPARLVIYPDENHWILKPQNSRHWYGEVFAWLDRYTGTGRRGRGGRS
ncbi:MAG: S9 family peptidase [Candidatus Eisenbacteria bacterium]|nr:S9 family peptidase [Candidatus Eisenbacteria bacterium]